MEYSGSASVAVVEDDLALSEDDDGIEHWPFLESSRQPQHSASIKRAMNREPDSSSTPTSPAAKSSRRAETTAHRPATDASLPRLTPQITPLLPPSGVPAFAPRDEYIKLAFKENPNSAVKLRWLNDVTAAFRLDREKAEVKMSAVTSRFVYISRCRRDIIDRVTGGEFLSLHLDIQDSIDRPRKFPTYLITRYPVDVDPSLAKELPGVYTVRRFRQNGTPINRLVITWSLLTPPPPTFEFSFLPCLPPCDLRRMKDEQPWCFNCWGIGHISRYCSALGKCAWCAAGHASRSCPHRTPSTPTAPSASSSTTETSSTSEPDTSKWKCPRCLMSGVNVWHGCARRSHTDTHHPQQQPQVPPPAPPPPPAASPNPPDSAKIVALHTAVATLQSRCTDFTERFDAIDARFNDLIESFQVIATSVTALTDRLDVLTSRYEASCYKKSGDSPSTKPLTFRPGELDSTYATLQSCLELKSRIEASRYETSGDSPSTKPSKSRGVSGRTSTSAPIPSASSKTKAKR